MRKIVFVLFIIPFALNAMAQVRATQDASCTFLRSLKFKSGVDTIKIKASYYDFHISSDEPILKILNKKEKLFLNDYVDSQIGASSVSFTPEYCNGLYEGTLSRRIYDKTFVRKTKDIALHMKDMVDMNNLKAGQTIYLKCLVFEDEKLKDNSGVYFFTIVDVEINEY
ncbi:hypothetical protein [Mucilaginibacter lappiensis]|jgi:hypothetical protein|uniref:hypothetical protein n=1 Tax=Mucilaginibacter lappiensis TaxID=354630 RepID=UPI003D2182E3